MNLYIEMGLLLGFLILLIYFALQLKKQHNRNNNE